MATTKATTLAHNIAHSGVTSAVLSAKAPLASPAFTGTPDFSGVSAFTHKDDMINGNAVAGGEIGSVGVSTNFRGVIANSSLASTVTFPAGIIVNFDVVSDRTRTTVSVNNSTDIEFYNIGNYNKLNAGTDLIIQVILQGGNSADANYGNIGLRFGSSSTYWGGGYNQQITNYMQLTITGYFTGHTTTGSQAISCRMGSESGTNTRPCAVVNPSSTEDARMKASGSQAFSHAFVYEVMP